MYTSFQRNSKCVETLIKLHMDMFGGQFQKLQPFMCGDVASKLDQDYLWAGLKRERLRTYWGMDKADLRKFMCGGVASKLNTDCIWTGIKKLHTDCDMDKVDLRTFMCGGFASRFDCIRKHGL